MPSTSNMTFWNHWKDLVCGEELALISSILCPWKSKAYCGTEGMMDEFERGSLALLNAKKYRLRFRRVHAIDQSEIGLGQISNSYPKTL